MQANNPKAWEEKQRKAEWKKLHDAVTGNADG
jgi:hypothetical protein